MQVPCTRRRPSVPRGERLAEHGCIGAVLVERVLPAEALVRARAIFGKEHAARIQPQLG